ncbi:hypothetical protein [Azohydromonas caseinilytica]|uniref:Transglycosylase SLT domain-containing protein n=1 Tax=Azohydromonas caseinilytica TaxID=2728836 RepID=A0A848FC70_9BURK|nr:hypothetical protein [Azohydromonas caseinilytica]NML16536.1 hypothetical protein [Azohydromonas caseinilytica]
MASAQQANEFRKGVIKPTLLKIGLWSPAAEELLLGTALKESRLKFRRQIGGGPARGLFQMEPATHDDIWKNFLKFRAKLADQVMGLRSSPGADPIQELTDNDAYAAAMARVHYLRAPAALPPAGDVQAMAAYWKKHYNTVFGAGTAKSYVDAWNEVFGA